MPNKAFCIDGEQNINSATTMLFKSKPVVGLRVHERHIHSRPEDQMDSPLSRQKSLDLDLTLF